MKFNLAKIISSALKGRKQWKNLKNKYDIKSGIYFLLMADEDYELNEVALRHIDDMVAYRKAKGVVILTTEDWVVDSAKTYSKKLIDVNKITRKEAQCYYRYYYYYPFSEQFIVVTINRAYGFGGGLTTAVGVNGITKEDLVCLGLFIIRNFENAEPVNG